MRCNVPFAGFLRTTFHPKNGKALTQPVAAMLAALSAEEEPEVFVSPPPEELKCVICFDWLRDPVPEIGLQSVTAYNYSSRLSRGHVVTRFVESVLSEALTISLPVLPVERLWRWNPHER